ncbi:MAG: penicillin acylase family protein [Sandaracinus sp.]|nr:penicillin acylase family protein [Sandaracinus sp.]MCB9620753.1 penicillin acylase family protein [Sandaracinus sp.]MCB9624335.1 penicillin acylase family protein [Sandaracinus sp.]MCB9635492.1 penicillin acylase family protein [Sandaracinus sp.]
MRWTSLFLLLVACAADAPNPLVFEGPSRPVDVRRDDFGVVHVTGATAADVYYASGYVQASERLFQMDQMRRRAYGRRAEVIPDRAEDDLLVRHFDVRRLGEEAAERVRVEHPETHRLVVAWVAGVNARIDDVLAGRAPRPYGFELFDYEPERWDAVDPFAVGKLILFNNANQLEFDLLATLLEVLAPELSEAFPIFTPFDEAFVLPPEERPAAGDVRRTRRAIRRPLVLPDDAPERMRRYAERLRASRPGASNNWAIEGRHSANGRPLVGGDPHQPLASPSVFHMQHLRSDDGVLDVAGFAFVGTPAVQLGHNRHVAWTATTAYPDWMDLVEVRFVSAMAGGPAIELAGQRHAAVERVEVVNVRGEPAREVRVVEVPGVGLLLPDDFSPLPITRPGRRILFRWTGLRPTIEAHAFHALDVATSLDEAEAAIDRLELGAFNFVVADANGIAYRSRPIVPDRGRPESTPRGWVLVDGDDPSAAWSGALLPADRLPTSRGGDRGWVGTANNDPFGFTSDGAVEGDAWYWGVWGDPGTRATRIEAELERLVSRGNVTTDDFETLQRDTYSMFAERYLPFLFDAAEALDDDESLAAWRGRDDLAALIERLRTWDRRMDRASSEAVVFQAWVYFAVQDAIGDDLGLLFQPLLDASTVYVLKLGLQAFEDAPTLLDDGVAPTVYRALERTADFLVARYGGIEAERYTWGELHGTHFANLGGRFDRGWFPTDGADGTVDVSDATFLRDGEPVERVSSSDGPVYRMVASFGEDGVPSARVAFAGGHSEDPDSPWWDSTNEGWTEGRYVPLAFEEADVEARTVERATLDRDGWHPR